MENASFTAACETIRTMSWGDLFDYVADYTEYEWLVGLRSTQMELEQIVQCDLVEIGADAFFDRIQLDTDDFLEACGIRA